MQPVKPVFEASRFTCPHCSTLVKHHWSRIYGPDDTPADFLSEKGTTSLKRYHVSVCDTCYNVMLWGNGAQLYPGNIAVDPPNADMDADIQAYYQEAAAIASASPRSAAALLRLCLQRLLEQLGESGEHIESDIKRLVGKGLDERILVAMRCIQSIGNNAAHPGEIDFNDTPETAFKMFELINLIADHMLTRPREMAAFISSLPASAQTKITS